MRIANDMPFGHNEHYHGLLLRHVPAGCERALDVGCGSGAFARALAERAACVDAVDRSPEMIALAKQQAGQPANIRYAVADFVDGPPPSPDYDFVSCVAALHHMPFAPALDRLRGALRPGGVLAVLGLFRDATAVDFAYSCVAAAARIVVGATASRRGALEPRPLPPLAEPAMTLAETRAKVAELLPGATIRRLLFWRYLLVYRAPPRA